MRRSNLVPADHAAWSQRALLGRSPFRRCELGRLAPTQGAGQRPAFPAGGAMALVSVATCAALLRSACRPEVGVPSRCAVSRRIRRAAWRARPSRG